VPELNAALVPVSAPVIVPPVVAKKRSVSAVQDISVPSDVSTCPLVPAAKYAGFPAELPYIRLPLDKLAS